MNSYISSCDSVRTRIVGLSFTFIALSLFGTLLRPSAIAQDVSIAQSTSVSVPDADLIVETGHLLDVFAVSFSKNGALMASAGKDGTARLWETATGRQLRTINPTGASRDREELTPEQAQVHTVALSPEGSMIATGTGDGIVRIWDSTSAKLLDEYDGFSGIISSLNFSGSDQLLVTDTGGHCRILKSNGAVVQHFDLSSGYVQASFTPDGTRVITGSTDGLARLWEIVSGLEVKRFEGHNGSISSVAVSSDGTRLATGGTDHTARVWDAETGKELFSLQEPANVSSVTFSPDGRLLLTMSAGFARLYNINTQQLTGEVYETTLSESKAWITPDGETIVTGQDLSIGGIHFWSFKQAADNLVRLKQFEQDYAGIKKEILERKYWGSLELPAYRSFGATSLIPRQVHLSPDGAYIGFSAHTVHIFNSVTGRQISDLSADDQTVSCFAISPDSRTVLTGAESHLVRLWEIDTGRELLSMKDATEAIHAVAFSPDGKYLAAADDNGALTVWNTANGEKLFQISDNHGALQYVGYFNSGDRLLIGDDSGRAIVVDAKTGDDLGEFPDYHASIKAAAFAPNGSFMVIASMDGRYRTYDATTGKTTGEFIDELQGGITSIAISPDSKWIADGTSFRRTIMVRNAESDERFQLHGHTEVISSLVFTPDSRELISSAWDSTVRIWDLRSHRELAKVVFGLNGEWVVVDPYGRFDSNALDNGAPLHWVLQADPYHTLPLEIFMRDYYTPGLLAAILNGRADQLPKVRPLDKIKSRTLPVVQITNVAPAESGHGVDVTVHVSALEKGETNQESGLQELRLFRNGQLVTRGWVSTEASGRKSLPRAERSPGGTLKSGDYMFHEVLLRYGTKSVRFSAYGFNGEGIKSVTSEIKCDVFPNDREIRDNMEKWLDLESGRPAAACRIVVPSVASMPVRRAYLLQIGINHYAASGCELRDAVTDAERMSAALQMRLAAQGYVVEAIKLESVGPDTRHFAGHDAILDASLQQIRKQLGAIAAKAGPDDVFFMSFSGHGYSDKNGMFYILPADAAGSCKTPTKNQLGSMLSNSISADLLGNWLRPIDAGDLTLILDACYAAESIEAGGFKPGPLSSKGLGQVAYDKRMRVLAASQSTAVAHEYDFLGEGLLTYVLEREGLERGKADWRPTDEKITVGEWLSYAANAVPRFSPQGIEPLAANGAHKSRGLEFDACNPSSKSCLGIQVPALFDYSKDDSLIIGTLDTP